MWSNVVVKDVTNKHLKQFLKSILIKNQTKIKKSIRILLYLLTNHKFKKDEAFDEKEVVLTIFRVLLEYKQTAIFIITLKKAKPLIERLNIPHHEILYTAIQHDNVPAIDAIIVSSPANVLNQLHERIQESRFARMLRCNEATYKCIIAHIHKFNTATNSTHKIIFNIDDSICVLKGSYHYHNSCTEEGFKQRYARDITQNQFQKYGKITALLISSALKNNKFKLSFDSESDEDTLTLYKLGQYRADIANYSHYQFAKERKFGTPRKGPLHTPLYGQYKEFKQAFYKDVLPAAHKNLKILSYKLNCGTILNNAQIYVDLRGERIPLTKIDADGTDDQWHHTKVEYVQPLLAYVEELISEIREVLFDQSDTKSYQLLIEKIANVHWFLAHATPFHRGSAAITEWIVQGLFEYHGISVNLNIMIDCHALIQPDIDRFAAEYAKYFTLENPFKPTAHSVTNDHDNAQLKQIVNYPLNFLSPQPNRKLHSKHVAPEIYSDADWMRYAVLNHQSELIHYLLDNKQSTEDELKQARMTYDALSKGSSNQWLAFFSDRIKSSFYNAGFTSALFATKKYLLNESDCDQQVESVITTMKSTKD